MSNKNRWDADKYAKHADFVSNLASPLIELLNPKKDEKILDLGCGDGMLAVEIEKSGAIVRAVDLSEDMVKKAQKRGVKASVMSAEDLAFEDEFDAIFSNAVLHWVKNKDRAIKNIANSLKKRGRFVAEFGGYGNIRSLTDAMADVFSRHKEFGAFNNPWYFPKDMTYKELLENNGFDVSYIKLISRPTKVDDISNWLDIFANGIISHLSQEQQNLFKQEVREILKPKIYSKKDGWVVDYVRLRLKAYKKL